MGYKDYVKVHDKYLVQYDSNRKDKVPDGHYQLSYIPDMDQLIFEKIKFNHDELLELPSKEFAEAASQVDTFLTPESKQLFEDYGFVYKRSLLFHGVPGTGKTCLANRIANKVVSLGGVVLFNPNPAMLHKAFKALNEIQPDTKIVIVFEELDQLVKTFEHELLNLLDGEIQQDNVIYLATTNYISQVPARIMRPGRFPSVVEIKYPDEKCREFYLNKKIGHIDTQEEIKNIVKTTAGFSIDELKEVVLSTKCLQIPLKDTVDRIKETKELCKNDKVFREYDEWNQMGITHRDFHGTRSLTAEVAEDAILRANNGVKNDQY